MRTDKRETYGLGGTRARSDDGWACARRNASCGFGRGLRIETSRWVLRPIFTAGNLKFALNNRIFPRPGSCRIGHDVSRALSDGTIANDWSAALASLFVVGAAAGELTGPAGGREKKSNENH